MALILEKGIIWQKSVTSINGKIDIRLKSLYIFLTSAKETKLKKITILNL